jgi:tetratricopeptide (TPR) repeat protein
MESREEEKVMSDDLLATEEERQLNFLLTVLQSIADNGANSDVVYPLLKQNLEFLNDELIEVLQIWASDIFAEVDRDAQKLISATIGNFGNLIQQFPLGNKAVNMELSIICFGIILEIFTVDEDAEAYASILNGLAIAYSSRIKEDRAENIEKAINCYLLALKIYTKKDFPIQWAITQNNLANAYRNRIKEDRTENLEKAIACYSLALEIRTKEDFPMDWAQTQNNLANAYQERIIGDRAENLEQSAEYYRSALEIYTVESFPRDWAAIQARLAQFSIDKLCNYPVAIEHLQAAYEHLLSNHNDTGLLAQTMFELARCFHKTGALSQAKIYFKDSIRLYQRLEQPTQVAAITSELGNLELQMGQIDDARIHLQTALDFYQTAEDIYLPEETRRNRITSIQELQQYLPVSNGEKVA